MGIEETIKTISDYLDELAITEGFTSEGSGKKLEGKVFVSWARDVRWKIDRMVFVYAARAATDVVVNLEVRLPLDDGRRLLLDGQGVAWLAGMGRSSYQLSVESYGAANGLPQRVRADVRKQFGWFDQYGTPEQCIHALQGQGHRNGCRPGFEPALAHLRRAISKDA